MTFFKYSDVTNVTSFQGTKSNMQDVLLPNIVTLSFCRFSDVRIAATLHGGEGE